MANRLLRDLCVWRDITASARLDRRLLGASVVREQTQHERKRVDPHFVACPLPPGTSSPFPPMQDTASGQRCAGRASSSGTCPKTWGPFAEEAGSSGFWFVAPDLSKCMAVLPTRALHRWPRPLDDCALGRATLRTRLQRACVCAVGPSRRCLWLCALGGSPLGREHRARTPPSRRVSERATRAAIPTVLGDRPVWREVGHALRGRQRRLDRCAATRRLAACRPALA